MAADCGSCTMLAGIWDDLKQSWKQPFRADMSAADWFLFLGLIIVILVAWRIILNHILED